MLGHLQYGKIQKYDVKVINLMKPYETYSRSRRLPEGTILWDVYLRYALEDIRGLSPEVKRECIAFTFYRSFYYNRLRFFQVIAPEAHFKYKDVSHD